MIFCTCVRLWLCSGPYRQMPEPPMKVGFQARGGSAEDS